MSRPWPSRAQPGPRIDQLTAADQFLVKGLVIVQMRRNLVRLPLLHGRLDDASFEIDRQEVSGHLTPPSPSCVPNLALSPLERSTPSVLDIPAGSTLDSSLVRNVRTTQRQRRVAHRVKRIFGLHTRRNRVRSTRCAAPSGAATPL